MSALFGVRRQSAAATPLWDGAPRTKNQEPRTQPPRLCARLLLIPALLLAAPAAQAATFNGGSRVEADDPSGALSVTNNIPSPQFTVSCWFKIAIPSSVTLSTNMVILVNQQNGTETGSPYAYLLRYNFNNGRIEFLARGSSQSPALTLIQSPYLERWYHVAVIRDGQQYYGFVDGRSFTGNTISANVGDSRSTAGISIGSWEGSGVQPFYGDIQEVAIYNQALDENRIRDRMFKDQAQFADIKGYYKLGYTTLEGDRFKNYVPAPPSGTSPGRAEGTVVFEETDEGGEQSAFDARKNGGQDAIAPLSGAFSWSHSLLSRPTPGVGYDFSIAYSSALNTPGSKVGSLDPYIGPDLGIGWRHTFEAQVLPDPVAASTEYRVINWDGSIETWARDTNGIFRTRHNEYRGEFKKLDPGEDFEWTTPQRIIYRFRSLAAGDVMGGRLMEIRDLNSNRVQVVWNEGEGLIDHVVDSAGGIHTFRYAGTRLTNVAFSGWNLNFSYDASNLLSSHWITAPEAYTPVNTAWSYFYTNSGLNRIMDPRGNTNVFLAYDKYARVTSLKDGLGRETKTEYNVPSSRSIRRTDPTNQVWVELYDRKGRVLAQSNPLNQKASFTYDSRGNRISATEPLGWTTYFGYDAQANLISQTNALGEVRNWTYDLGFNKPLTETDPLGWTTRYEYDGKGNLLRQYDDIGNIARFAYRPDGLVHTAWDANGKPTRSEYDANGFLRTRTDPANNAWQYGRDDLGWPTAETDPLSQVTTYAYDINGRVVRKVDPLFREFRSLYDANGNVTEVYDAKGQVTRHVFDAANQKIQTTDRMNGVWKFGYTPLGKIERVIDPLSVTNTIAYDEASRARYATDPYSYAVETVYDANGNIIARIDKLNRRWSKVYDRLNRVIEEKDPFEKTKTTAYDAAGRVSKITSPNGFTQHHEYDGRGRLTKWIDAEGYPWAYAYDGVGNIEDIEDALGGHYVMEYGDRNERIMERNQDGKEWHYRYDALLRPDQQTDPNGTLRTVTYDAGGRIDYVSFSTGRVDDYGYDDNNNVTLLSRSRPGEPPTSTMFAYDVLDRVTEVTDAFSKRVRYGYDKMGRVIGLTYPDNRVLQQGFDRLGRLTSQTDWGSRVTAYAYDAADRMVYRRYPNGIVQSNQFDEAGRLIDLRYIQPGGAVLTSYSHAYDDNGNRTDSTALGTLDWPEPSAINETADYTGSGRLKTRVDAVKTNQNTWAYHYDESGNMTNCVGGGESFTFAYDEDNRVTLLGYDGGTSQAIIRNRYDALGRRISRTKDGEENRYALDLQGSMERILCDMTPAGQVTAHYVHGPDLCYKVETNNTLLCYHADAQANIVSLTDTGATNVAQYAYTPYGRTLNDRNTSVPREQSYLFLGSLGVLEETPELHFMRARYYSAQTCSFLSTDPIKPATPPLHWALYRYANNNPITYMDPSGLLTYKPETLEDQVKNTLEMAVLKKAIIAPVVKSAIELVGASIGASAGAISSTSAWAPFAASAFMSFVFNIPTVGCNNTGCYSDYDYYQNQWIEPEQSKTGKTQNMYSKVDDRNNAQSAMSTSKVLQSRTLQFSEAKNVSQVFVPIRQPEQMCAVQGREASGSGAGGRDYSRMVGGRGLTTFVNKDVEIVNWGGKDVWMRDKKNGGSWQKIR